MSVKKVLKDGKQMIVKGEFSKARDLLQEAVDSGETDYELLCFCALATSSLEEEDSLSSARLLYSQAIGVNDKELLAWKGVLKLYIPASPDSPCLEPDDVAIEAIERVVPISDAEKAQSLRRKQLEFLWKLKQVEALLEKGSLLGDHSDLLFNISSALANKSLSPPEQQLVVLCLKQLQGSDDFHLLHLRSRLLHKLGEYAELREVVLKAGKVYDKEKDSEEWLRQRIIDILAIECTVQGQVHSESMECAQQMELCSSEDAVIRLVVEVAEGELESAAETLESLTVSSLAESRPLPCLAVLPLLIRDERYEECLNLMALLRLPPIPLLRESVVAVKAECLLRLGDPSSLHSASLLLPLPPRFSLCECLLRHQLHLPVEPCLLATLSAQDNRRFRARSEKTEEAEAIAVDLGEEEDAEWSDLLLAAEKRLERGEETKATSLLIKVAKLNGRCSRAFFLLASALRRKNPEKALALVSRAASIRPPCTEYALLADKLRVSTGRSSEERIAALSFFTEMSQAEESGWAWLELGRLHLSAGHSSRAVDCLQKAIRLSSERGREEAARVWSWLGEAYSARGQLVASANSFRAALQHCAQPEWAISLVQVLLRLDDAEKAIEEGEEWFSKLPPDSSSRPALQLVLLQARLKKAERKKEDLAETASALVSLLALLPRTSLAAKLAADSFVLLADCPDALIDSCCLPLGWPSLKKPCDALRVASLLYTRAASLRREDPHIWADLANSLLLRCRFEGDKTLADKAWTCVSHSLSLSALSSAGWRSHLWTLLADAEEKRGLLARRVQHCLARAIQLNPRNDKAWTRLGLLFLEFREEELAHACLERATKWNPQSAEAFAAWGHHAESKKVLVEAEEMMLHSLALKPTVYAMQRFAAHIRRRLISFSKIDTSRMLIHFDSILPLRQHHSLCGKSQHDLSLLCEVFGYFSEGIDVALPGSLQMNRLILKRDLEGAVASVLDEKLAPLRLLCTKSSNELKDLIEQHGLPLSAQEEAKEEEKGAEEGGDGEKKPCPPAFPSLKTSSLSVPLLVSALIAFDQSMSESFVNALHDLRPRHELVDFFPTLLPDGIDNGIRFIEEDGEEPFRFSHHLTQPLLEVLKCRRESLASSLCSATA